MPLYQMHSMCSSNNTYCMHEFKFFLNKKCSGLYLIIYEISSAFLCLFVILFSFSLDNCGSLGMQCFHYIVCVCVCVCGIHGMHSCNLGMLASKGVFIYTMYKVKPQYIMDE